MKNICGKFCCRQTSMRKVFGLVFEWRIYASFRNLCISTYDAYMRHSASKVLKYFPRKVWSYILYQNLWNISSYWSMKKSRELFLFKRNAKPNHKGTLTPKMSFAADSHVAALSFSIQPLDRKATIVAVTLFSHNQWCCRDRNLRDRDFAIKAETVNPDRTFLWWQLKLTPWKMLQKIFGILPNTKIKVFAVAMLQ